METDQGKGKHTLIFTMAFFLNVSAVSPGLHLSTTCSPLGSLTRTGVFRPLVNNRNKNKVKPDKIKTVPDFGKLPSLGCIFSSSSCAKLRALGVAVKECLRSVPMHGTSLAGVEGRASLHWTTILKLLFMCIGGPILSCVLFSGGFGFWWQIGCSVCQSYGCVI